MFDLSEAAIASSLGWYFVFGERPGQPRFGLNINPEIPSPTDPNQLDPTNPTTWEAFSWQHIPADSFHLDVNDLYLTDSAEEIAVIKNSAHLAYALFRQPASVALALSDFMPPA